MVTRCCWFDLKYGYLAYASISVAIRTTLMVFFYFLVEISLKSNYPMYMWPPFPLIGWFFTAILFSFLTIVGIIQDRSIFIFPYIAILIFEVVLYVLILLVLSFIWTPFFLFGFFGLLGIYCFDAICLISLYKTIKTKEIVIEYQDVTI